MKSETSQDKDGKLRAEELLQRTTGLLSLKFEGIQGLQPEKKLNGSVHGDFKIPISIGTHCLLIFKTVNSMSITDFDSTVITHPPPGTYYDP